MSFYTSIIPRWDFSNLVDDFFFSFPADPKPPVSWAVVGEEDQSVVIQLAVAGFKEEDIKVWHENKTLRIVGDNTKREGLSTKFSCKFDRAWRLSDKLDVSKTEVKLEDGILAITIPIIKPEVKRTYFFGEE